MRATSMLLTATLLFVPFTLQAQDWRWQGRVRSSDVMEVKGINGGIRAVPSDGDQVEVEATIREGSDGRFFSGRRGRASDVRLVTVPHDSGVTVCAIYEAPDGRDPNECTPGSRGRSNVNSNVQVDFLVRVPRGVRFAGRTVNGDVSITGMTADARGHTVNGSVEVRTTGIAEASTTNGSIDATMGRADWREPLRFSTTNGNIRLNMPSNLDMDVRVSTTNGEIQTDYPITIEGTMSARTLRGIVGRGGRSLSATTTNGDVLLRRRN
jgi:hypothetical protein